MTKRRFAVVGTGTRATYAWVAPMLNEFADVAQPVGLYDVNPGRAHATNAILKADIPVYSSFDEMIRLSKPEALMVTSTDATHADYVVRGLAAGLEVYSEKPLCTTFAQVSQIREAARQARHPAWVTHNARFLPAALAVKREIGAGRIGDIRHITFHELLDRYHGADYFRRWHRDFRQSGGLLLQKASHHFDLINWWVGSRPRHVSAQGGLFFYGKNGPYRGPRCSECPHAKECALFADVFDNDLIRRLFKEVETEDGYFRDRCVFGEEIDITDTANLSISYENGVQVSYSLVAYASYEGQQVALEGTDGRLEWNLRQTTLWAAGRKKRGASSLVQSGQQYDRVTFTAPYEDQVETDCTPPPVEGGHGGADPQLREMLFRPTSTPDPLGRRAVLEEGIQAVLVGIAANRSIALGGRPVDIQTCEPVWVDISQRLLNNRPEAVGVAPIGVKLKTVRSGWGIGA
jgi:predicted dehydrogenase